MLYRQNLPKFLLGFAPLAHPLLTSPPCIDLPLPFPLLQLGTGDLQDRMIPTEVPLALESEAGQLVRAMQVHCGAQHTLALVQLHGQHQVRSVGGNNYGELGLGDRVERHRFHPIPGLQVGTLRGRWGMGGWCVRELPELPCCIAVGCFVCVWQGFLCWVTQNPKPPRS